MSIRINHHEFNKEGLLNIIKTNKLQAIIHIRSITNIGLKDAKDIVEHLNANPNYYDNAALTLNTKPFEEGENFELDISTKQQSKQTGDTHKKQAPHIIKSKPQSKIYIAIIILVSCLVLFLILQNNN